MKLSLNSIFRRKSKKLEKGEVPIEPGYFKSLVGKELVLVVPGQDFVDKYGNLGGRPCSGVVLEVVSREPHGIETYFITNVDTISTNGAPLRSLFPADEVFKQYIFVPSEVGVDSSLYFRGVAREHDMHENEFVDGLEHQVEVYSSKIPKTKLKGVMMCF